MIKNEKMLEEIIKLQKSVRKTKPLVHCMTNRVTINDCANIILAGGGTPTMAEDEREVEEIVSISKGLVLNIGILGERIVKAMIQAGKKAKSVGVPVIFDPVGAGASKLRSDVSVQVLEEVKPDVIRGNMSEIKCLAGIGKGGNGVDADIDDYITEDNAKILGDIVKAFAKRHSAVVCATGAIDIISDGENTYYIKNGHAMLCDVTGTGCMCSALCGAYCGAGDYLTGVVATIMLVGLAGELAFEYVTETKQGIGTFHQKFFDYIYTIDENLIRERGLVFSEED